MRAAEAILSWLGTPFSVLTITLLRRDLLDPIFGIN